MVTMAVGAMCQHLTQTCIVAVALYPYCHSEPVGMINNYMYMYNITSTTTHAYAIYKISDIWQLVKGDLYRHEFFQYYMYYAYS